LAADLGGLCGVLDTARDYVGRSLAGEACQRPKFPWRAKNSLLASVLLARRSLTAMSYIVTQHCVDCKYTDCVSVCPVDAFHEGPRMVYINPDTCVNCDACVPACPIEAIFSEENLPSKFA